MLKGDLVLLKYLQHLTTEAHLGVHAVLLDGDDREALLARHTRDDVLGVVAQRMGYDHGALVLGAVGVADVDGNAGGADGEHGVLVENGSTHVGQLAELAVGDLLDDAGVVDDAGVGHHEAGHVSPVLIEIGLGGLCYDGAGDIGSTAGEGLDGAVGGAAVEAGDDGVLVLLQLSRKLGVGLFLIQRAVVLEEDDVLGIDEVKTQIFRQNQGVEVLTAGGGITAACGVKHGVLDVVQLTGDVEIQAQVGNDAYVTGTDLVVAGFDGLHGGAGLDEVVAAVEQVGDLGIALVPLTGGGGNDVAAVGIGLDDGGYLTEMLGIGQRAAAEFDNFDRHGEDLLWDWVL